MKQLDVTCAVIEKDGKVLVTQRSQHMPLPLLWEFPGGKLEEGETEQACLAREINEELQVRVEPYERLTPVTFHDGQKTIRLIPYRCRLKDGNVRLTEHKQFLWLLPEELLVLSWCPADVPIAKEWLRVTGNSN